MKKMNLSKLEKRVLIRLSQGAKAKDLGSQGIAAIRSLEDDGLVKGLWVSGGGLEGVYLTEKGKTYLLLNPKLHNPINWTAIAATGAWVAAIVSLIALFIACSH